MLTEVDIRIREEPLVVGYGGGVNSLAALIAMRHRGIRPDLITFADTGGLLSDGEKPETYSHISTDLKPWLERAGFPPLTVVYNKSPISKHDSLEDDCLNKETLPSRAFGMSSCAQRWKIEPQDKFLKNWAPAVEAWRKGLKPVKVLGYDGGETGRAEVFEDDKLKYWYPLIEWNIDREECIRIIKGAGLKIPPKSACFYCPSSTKTEVIQLALRRPDYFARAVKMETRALASTRHDLRNVKGLGRHWSWKELVEADEATRAAMREAPVESCLICDDGSCDLPDASEPE